MPYAPDFEALLKTAPTIRLQKRLARVVPDAALHKITPPNYLFTSGKPGRYNPEGIECVYFCEEKRTAEIEFESGLKLPANKFQPHTIYWADIDLRRVLDLANPMTLAHLSLVDNDLRVCWRGVALPVKTQLLGAAAAAGGDICAIRYPSAAIMKGKPRYNIAIFKSGILAPDTVRILGPDYAVLQKWP